MMNIKNLTLTLGVASTASAVRLNSQVGAQLETENFWHDIGHAFDSAAKSVGNTVKKTVDTGVDVVEHP